MSSCALCCRVVGPLMPSEVSFSGRQYSSIIRLSFENCQQFGGFHVAFSSPWFCDMRILLSTATLAVDLACTQPWLQVVAFLASKYFPKPVEERAIARGVVPLSPTGGYLGVSPKWSGPVIGSRTSAKRGAAGRAQPSAMLAGKPASSRHRFFRSAGFLVMRQMWA